jgi:DNA polymerase I-like protein with 3'-5' exonuclease and polymerase domains
VSLLRFFVKSYIQEQIEFARENGYVRRRRQKILIPKMQWCVAVRATVNAPIQGSALTLLK